MNESELNPSENQLPPGIDEKELTRSITTSGFPLQGFVAHLIKSKYGVTEEWSYVDRDSEGLRSLDVFAYRKLSGVGNIHPFAVLLIECKSSIHPYVFFQNAVERSFPFPTICGTPLVQIRQKAGRDGTFQECQYTKVLGLADTPFGSKPPICSAFTKAISKGKKVQVSGTDPFNSIILPLVKATDHAISLYGSRTSNRKNRLHPALILNICVLDAPMIVVGNPSNGQSARLAPWVRVLRQEAKPKHNNIFYDYYVVDFVHRGFLGDFFGQHIEDFLDTYTKRVCVKSDILFGGGVVDNLDSWTWREVSAV
jgi:hypothetical protein